MWTILRALVAGLLLVMGVTAVAGAQRPSVPPLPALAALAARLTDRIGAVAGAEVALSYRDLATGDSLDLAADVDFHAASTMKIPVMVEVLRAVEAGRLGLDQGILLVNRFPSIADGSPFALDAGDDSDSLMYARIGQRVPVRELLERMITRSSNLATNALIALVGADRANATAHALGASHIRVLRGVEDGKAYAAGMNNTTTSADLAVLLQRIERNEALGPASAHLMKEILLRQEFNAEIPAGLPPGTPVAHKTGSITGTLHDAAIVYPPGRAPYVLVVLTRKILDEATARTLIADLSRLVWAYSTEKPAATIGTR
jgi:beta-lactamase class A